MRYEVMGPLHVVDDDGSRAIRARKVEALLTVLLIRSDQVVTVDQLIREIWGDEPPRRVAAGLHVYVSQLRKFLRRPGHAQSPILTKPSGYILALGDDSLDLRRFRYLVTVGRGHLRDHDHESASRSFERALGLCRGPMPDGLSRGPILQGFQSWLAEAQLECTELLMDARMALGRHRELISDLYWLSTEHPLREAFYRQLMTALHRSDCRGEALRVYQRARRTINDELGLEPGQALQDVQRAILTADGPLPRSLPRP